MYIYIYIYYVVDQKCEVVPLEHTVPWNCLVISLSKLLTSLVQSIIKYSEFPFSQHLRVPVSKGTCSHGQVEMRLHATQQIAWESVRPSIWEES